MKCPLYREIFNSEKNGPGGHKIINDTTNHVTVIKAVGKDLVKVPAPVHKDSTDDQEDLNNDMFVQAVDSISDISEKSPMSVSTSSTGGQENLIKNKLVQAAEIRSPVPERLSQDENFINEDMDEIHSVEINEEEESVELLPSERLEQNENSISKNVNKASDDSGFSSDDSQYSDDDEGQNGLEADELVKERRVKTGEVQDKSVDDSVKNDEDPMDQGDQDQSRVLVYSITCPTRFEGFFNGILSKGDKINMALSSDGKKSYFLTHDQWKAVPFNYLSIPRPHIANVDTKDNLRIPFGWTEEAKIFATSVLCYYDDSSEDQDVEVTEALRSKFKNDFENIGWVKKRYDVIPGDLLPRDICLDLELSFFGYEKGVSGVTLDLDGQEPKVTVAAYFNQHTGHVPTGVRATTCTGEYFRHGMSLFL